MDNFNESVNFEKQAIFIAIPKTGTTTVRSQFAQKGNDFIPNPHLSIMQVRDALYTYLLKTSLGKNHQFPSVNVSTDASLRTYAKEIFDSFFKFSSVRNPWDRAVSLFLRGEGVQMRNKLSFDNFCEHHWYASDTCLHPTLHENQLDWLCDETGDCIMDYVYKIEEFEIAISEIEERTNGRVRLKYRKLNTNSKSGSKNYREFYSDRTCNMIAEKFKKDINFFRYTF